MNEVNIYGCGFIGKEYHKKYSGIINEKDDLIPKSNNILYFISTVDNYNVFEDPLIDIETNLITLMKSLNECKIKYGKDFTFNFISSWFVYGDCPLPAKESYSCSPKGFYSITKKAAEDLLISYCETFEINYRILRLCNVLGRSDNKVSKKKNAFQFILNQLKSGEPVSLYNGGHFYRDYMHVEDVVSAINTVINTSVPNQIYNIGSGDKVEFLEMVNFAKDKLNSKSEIINIFPSEFHTKVQSKDMILDVEKLNNLQFQRKYKNIEEIIEQLI
jgi:nucleoside-diphosphate-sugar epimerase